jgi:hypothetical protein
MSCAALRPAQRPSSQSALLGLIGLARLELGLEPVAPVALHLVDFAGGDDALADELLGIDLERRAMRADLAIHQRLREARLVALVVAEAAIAEHVDDDRLVELLPELRGDLGREHHRFGIVAIDVEDRRLDQLRHIRRIGRGARIARISGEADLVVDDEVDRAAGAIALQSRQAEAFRHHALPGEGRVAMDQQRHHLAALDDVVELVLLGAHLAEHDGIDDLEMRRIGGERQMHLVGVELAIGRGAEVILDVARAFHFVGRVGAALELVEQGAMRLGQHLRQHVEAAAMGHAEHDLLHAEIAAALDDLFERRDQRLAAVEAEALGAGVFDVDELLETFRLDQLVEDRALALAGEGDLLVRALDALLNPRLLGGIGDVHEFVADRAAIGAAQDLQHLADRRVVEAEHLVEEDRPVVVALVEAVARGMKLLVILRRGEAERIEIGMQMAAHAIGADHHQRVHRIARRALQRLLGHLLAALGGLGLDLVADRLLGGGPVAVERVGQIVIGRQRPVRTLPRGALRLGGALAEPLEEFAPFRIDARRILLVAGLELLDIDGVRSVEERGPHQRRVGILT